MMMMMVIIMFHEWSCYYYCWPVRKHLSTEFQCQMSRRKETWHFLVSYTGERERESDEEHLSVVWWGGSFLEGLAPCMYRERSLLACVHLPPR